ncbi:tRNA:m(4)X modification enzyme TRM13 [Borealophlyctis nickersoniae]|nr:tRNA:m(4)X modification enzyme TRM13 [Borealophlyctis nickersoniae]
MGKRAHEPDEPRPPPKETTCHFWVKRKNRYCNMIKKKGRKYCGEHSYMDQEQPQGERIPCPYDNKHTVYASELDRHLARCNSKPKPLPPCHVENCNIGKVDASTLFDGKAPRDVLANMDRATFDALVTRIRGWEETNGGKHALQQSSLLGHAQRLGLLQQNRMFIEFGAGKGELSNYVHMAVGDPSKYLLVDRKNFRMKFDRVLKTLTTFWERLSMDIKDLDLSKVESVKGEKVVGVSKHLCGAATDLALRCLANYDAVNDGLVEGLVFALCCHQICRHGMYINPEYLFELGISEEDFAFMCVIGSWGTCGQRPAPEKKADADAGSAESVEMTKDHVDKKRKIAESGEEGEEEPEHCMDGVDVADREDGEHWSGLTFAQREELGFQCKRILDVGRARFLEKKGFAVELVYYVEKATSLENLALLAVRPSQKQ